MLHVDNHNHPLYVRHISQVILYKIVEKDNWKIWNMLFSLIVNLNEACN